MGSLQFSDDARVQQLRILPPSSSDWIRTAVTNAQSVLGDGDLEIGDEVLSGLHQEDRYSGASVPAQETVVDTLAAMAVEALDERNSGQGNGKRTIADLTNRLRTIDSSLPERLERQIAFARMEIVASDIATDSFGIG